MRNPAKKNFYRFADKIHVAVDCIIFGFTEGEIKLLLFKRRVNPFKNNWSLIGSFIGLEESAEAAVTRVLRNSTGLDQVFMSELGSYTAVERDSGGRVISLAYYALIRIGQEEEYLVEDYEARWFDVDRIPPLILDHEQMVNDALEQLRLNARTRAIGFELLPEKFTLPQLQSLYEAIFRYPLDARNFRKKVLSLDIVKRLDEKDKSGSRKGAYLYQFNRSTPEEFRTSSQLFDF